MPRQLRAAAIPSQPNGASTGPETQGPAPALGSLTSPARVKRVKLIWLAVIAAFALTATAVTAGSASAAEPEWGHCVPVKSKGHFEDSNCTKEDFKENKAHEKKYKGKFEWDSGAASACFGQKKGHYKDSTCTEEDFKENTKTHEKKYKGKYELTGGPKFSAAAGAGVLKTNFYVCKFPGGEPEFEHRPRADCPEYFENAEEQVECESESATGEASGSDELQNVSVRFIGCSSFGIPATSAGLNAGEIQVNPLKGRLGYINKSTHEVGVLLEPVAAHGYFATFQLFNGNVELTVGEGNATEGSFYEESGPGVPTGNDGIISPITPVDTMTHTFTQNYRLTEPREDVVQNDPSHFEGEPNRVLEDTAESIGEFLHGSQEAWSPAGEELTNTNTVEGEAEIRG